MESKWISVNDKLPLFLEDVLCWASGDTVTWFPVVGYTHEYGWSQQYYVTHWMPLPEPPNE